MDNFYSKTIKASHGIRGIVVKAEVISIVASVQAILAVTLYFPSMPFIVQDFDVSHLMVQQAISLFIIGQAIIPLFLGYLADYFGCKKIMLISMILFSFSCFLTLIFPTAYGLLFSRFLQGGFSQAGVSISRAMVRGTSTYNETVKTLSWIAVIQSIVHLTGPFLGGWIIETSHWSNSFYILAVIGAISVALTFLWKEKTSKIDDITNEIYLSKTKEILCSLQFLGYSFIVSTLHLSTIFFFAMSPFYFITFCNISPELYGVYLGITSLGFMAGSLILTHFLNRFNHDKIIKISLYLGIFSGVIILPFSFYDRNIIELIIASQFLYAFSKALISPILQSKAVSLFPKNRATSSSVFNFISTIIAPLGALLGSIFSNEMAVLALSITIIFTSFIDVIFYSIISKKTTLNK